MQQVCTGVGPTDVSAGKWREHAEGSNTGRHAEKVKAAGYRAVLQATAVRATQWDMLVNAGRLAEGNAQVFNALLKAGSMQAELEASSFLNAYKPHESQ